MKFSVAADWKGLCFRVDPDGEKLSVGCFNPESGTKVPAGATVFFDISGYAKRSILVNPGDFHYSPFDLPGFSRTGIYYEATSAEEFVAMCKAVSPDVDQAKAANFYNTLTREPDSPIDYRILPYFPELKQALIDAGVKSLESDGPDYPISPSQLDSIKEEELLPAIDALRNALDSSFKSARLCRRF